METTYQRLADEKAVISSQHNQLTRETDNLKKQLKTAVDEVNTLLARKSFSWTIFLITWNKLCQPVPI